MGTQRNPHFFIFCGAHHNCKVRWDAMQLPKTLINQFFDADFNGGIGVVFTDTAGPHTEEESKAHTRWHKLGHRRSSESANMHGTLADLLADEIHSSAPNSKN